MDNIFSSIIIGIVAYLLSYMYYDPYRRYRELKCHISNTLTYYGNIYGVLGNENIAEEYKNKCKVGFDELRKCGAEIEAFINIVPYIHPFIPSKNDLHDVHCYLIGLSNMCDKYSLKDRIEIQKEIERILKLQVNTN